MRERHPPPLTSGGSTEYGESIPIRCTSSLVARVHANACVCTAPNALTNLKAKLKAAFRKKDKKPKAGESSGEATEAAKVDAPASKFHVAPGKFERQTSTCYAYRNLTQTVANDADSTKPLLPRLRPRLLRLPLLLWTRLPLLKPLRPRKRPSP